VLAVLTGTRPFSGLSLPLCFPVIAKRSIVLSTGAERRVSGVCRPEQPDPGAP
jgi:hypothetical protein